MPGSIVGAPRDAVLYGSVHRSLPIPDAPAAEEAIVAQTGNINSKQVEDAINDNYAGRPVFIPQFDGTCNIQPTGSSLGDCPAANSGGHGQNQWYRFTAVSTFRFCDSTIPECAAGGYTKGAYIQGNNKAICDTGNGATACLVGFFEKTLFSGEIGPADGVTDTTAIIGIQLLD
jgi:hypothetical protein